MLTDYLVTVCASCMTASCWHGEFMCQSAKYSGTTTRKASELTALARESTDNFSREKIREVCGVEPEEVEA